MGDKTIIEKFSIAYIIGLVLLMVIPIGNGSGLDVKINNIFIIGYRGDYIIHCLVYQPWMFAGKILYKERLNSLLWAIIGVLTVVVLEYTQMLLPYRGFNINDLVAGVIGILISYFMMLIIIKFQKSKKKNI